MSDEEDDPVVEEIPVFLSRALENQLHIFQYPTRPVSSSSDNENIIKCSFKPEHQELVMEVAVDTTSSNYDVSHGEQIAVNVDGGKPNQRFFQSSLMDKHTLQSTRVMTDMGSVAVGVLKNRQLVLAPVKGILSVQASFPYFDITEKRAREEAKEMGEDISGGEEEEGEKQVTVKFARQESDRFKKAREQSFTYLSKKSAEEKWYTPQYHPSTSRVAEVERSKLVSTEVSDQTSSLCLTSHQYLDALVPVQEDPTWALPSLPSHITSLTALSSLPMPDIVLSILKEVKIMTFRQLSSLLTPLGDEIKLLRSVQQVAVLVCGNWVVRSECLYPKDSVSEHNGVPGEIMCRARDYILYLLSEGKVLDRREVSATVKLPHEELKELLCQVSRLRRLRGWELLLPPDTEFIERNPEVVERQARAWATKYKQLMEALECEAGTKGRGRRRESSMSGGSDLESPGRPRPPRNRKDSSRSLGSDTDSTTETGARRKRNSESSDSRKVKTEPRKKRNSECDVSSEPKVNGKIKARRTTSEMTSPDALS